MRAGRRRVRHHVDVRARPAGRAGRRRPGWRCSARSRWPSTPPPWPGWCRRSRRPASSTRWASCCASCRRSAGCGGWSRDPRAGDVLAVVFRDDQFIPDQGLYGSTWRTDAARAGRGTLLEHSIHDVDILRWLFGPVAVGQRHHPGGPRPPPHRRRHRRPPRVRVGGVGHADLGVARRARAAQPAPRRGVLRAPVRGARGRLRGAGALAVHRLARGGAGRRGPGRGRAVGQPAATAFLTAVRDGTPAQPSFAEALPAHRVVDALYASAAAGGAVTAAE